MGAIRSAYSCPVFWYPGQVVPDTMHWYFADRCAGKFPFRHSFQTHYQYDKATPPQEIGEQPGPRPYSKGNGPVGAARFGITWLGDPEWFVSGVPSEHRADHNDCHPLVGHYPYPPPDSWWSLGMDAEGGVGYPFSFAPNFQDGLDWAWLEAGSSPYEPDALTRLHWFYVPGEGMHLTPGFTGAGVPDDPDGQFATFVETQDFGTFVVWTYTITSIHGFPPPFVDIVVTKCVP